MIIRVNEVNNKIRVLLNHACDFGSRAPSLSYCVLQVSCSGGRGASSTLAIASSPGL